MRVMGNRRETRETLPAAAHRAAAPGSMIVDTHMAMHSGNPTVLTLFTLGKKSSKYYQSEKLPKHLR